MWSLPEHNPWKLFSYPDPAPPQGSPTLWALSEAEGRRQLSQNFHEIVGPQKSLWKKKSKAKVSEYPCITSGFLPIQG